jgi:hypothetical protein
MQRSKTQIKSVRLIPMISLSENILRGCLMLSVITVVKVGTKTIVQNQNWHVAGGIASRQIQTFWHRQDTITGDFPFSSLAFCSVFRIVL